MAFIPNLFCSNHLDLFRNLIDAVALADKRTALKLAVLSKMTQAWVEPIIYAEVNLRNESSGRAFLHTMRRSKTKPPSFFAQHVKSLVICSDIKSRLVVEILSVCRRIINFSYWATPPSLSIRQPSSHSPMFATSSIVDRGSGPTAPDEVTPQRMSVLLHENHIYPLKPHFNLVFFSCVTHLSILNSWEEWTTWTYICSDAMPSLTHIKFDLNVQNNRPSRRSGILSIQHSEPVFMEEEDEEVDPVDHWNEVLRTMTPESLWLDVKLSRVANALGEVLNNSGKLRICILVLRFDSDPTYTTKFIARLASRKFFGGSGGGGGGGGHTTNDIPVVNRFDSRLVFAHEREPFRYSHAHSKHEMMLWKSAETIANLQRCITGYKLLDCSSST